MITDRLLEIIADECDAKPEELGPEWIAFAQAVACFIIKPGDEQDLGRLILAASRVP